MREERGEIQLRRKTPRSTPSTKAVTAKPAVRY
jgi:hypothetical protein